MSISNERLIIYDLMREIVKERRELSKQFYDLKSELEKLGKSEQKVSPQDKHSLSIFDREKINQQDFYSKRNKTQHYNSFDRVSKSILSILKESPVPLSNKQILAKLVKEYELTISLKNLSCNILPKMKNDRSLPVQKAYRGYWQYERFRKEGGDRQ